MKLQSARHRQVTQIKLGSNGGKHPSLCAQSSCISFSYWKETVSILLNPDRQSPSALVSYIEEPYMDIDRDFTEE